MATIERFEDLRCWQAGRRLKQLAYRFTRTKPFARDFALIDQIRRASQSVTSNIAEGFEREGNREFIQFSLASEGIDRRSERRSLHCLGRKLHHPSRLRHR